MDYGKSLKEKRKKKTSACLKEKLTQKTLDNKKKNVEHKFLKKFFYAAEKAR